MPLKHERTEGLLFQVINNSHRRCVQSRISLGGREAMVTIWLVCRDYFLHLCPIRVREPNQTPCTQCSLSLCLWDDWHCKVIVGVWRKVDAVCAAENTLTPVTNLSAPGDPYNLNRHTE